MVYIISIGQAMRLDPERESKMEIIWTPKLKTNYAETFISALNSLAKNPRFPKTIFAVVENEAVSHFDTIAAVHANSLDGETQFAVETVQEDTIGDGWARNEDGEIIPQQGDKTAVEGMVECMEGWDTFRHLSEAAEDAD